VLPGQKWLDADACQGVGVPLGTQVGTQGATDIRGAGAARTGSEKSGADAGAGWARERAGAGAGEPGGRGSGRAGWDGCGERGGGGWETLSKC
jgi:hypothetical protein